MASAANSTTLDRALGWISRAAPTRLTAGIGLICLSLLTAICTLCRLGGAFPRGLSPFGYCFCMGSAGLICCGLKVVADWPPYRLNRRAATVFGVLLSMPLCVLAISLLSANWTYGLLISAVLWLASVSWFCVSTRSTQLLQQLTTEVAWPEIERFLFPSVTLPAAVSAESHATLHRLAESTMSEHAEDEILSELQRRSTNDGDDVLEGQLVAVFAQGSRQAVLHVPFIPPFAVAPRVDCEIADGTEARVKVGAVFPYGVRLELKRNNSDLAEQEVALEIYAAVTTTSSADAA